MAIIFKNEFAFLRDYSRYISCLASIRQLEMSGAFNNLDELHALLAELEERLKKLYNRVTYVKLKQSNQSPPTLPPTGLEGDFEEIDFYSADFYTSVGYAVVFDTVIDALDELKSIQDQLSNEDKLYIDFALISFLDSLEALLAYLKNLGITPCTSLEEEYFTNSPYISLQACGSNGENGIAPGIHLRWSLSRSLGENHIPQGNLNNANSGTNFLKANDFVKLYRTPYINPVQIKLNFEELTPVVDNSSRMWTYSVNSSYNGVDLINTLKLFFDDDNLYNQIAVTANPFSQSFEFLKQYNGQVRLQLFKKTAFTVSLEINGSANGILKAGIYSTGDNENIDEDIFIAQKTVQKNSDGVVTESFIADNIRQIYISKNNQAWLQSITLETYHDFVTTRGPESWTLIGDEFGLSLDETTVFNRLENANYTIDNLWPHFNGGVKVNADNYRQKWNVSREDDPSLKELIQSYITLSVADSRANKKINLDSAAAEAEGLNVSFLEVINLMASDFHIARMLGLGYIDSLSASAANDKFIYKVVYTNRESIEYADVKTFEYLYLPTAKSDLRAPEKPVILPLKYQLSSAHEGTLALFDANGYSKLDNVRVVNISRDLYSTELEYDFSTDLEIVNNFNLLQTSRSVYYGVEYRSDNSTDYVKPEITSAKSFLEEHIYYSHDPSAPDGKVPEVVPVPDNIDSLFVHFETTTGVHHYAIYGIDWFSRSSPLSDEVSTDITLFKPKNTLMPPADVNAHYIQEEETLLFTTQIEQTWLAQRELNHPGADNCFTRVIFNWLDIVDISFLQTTTSADLSTVVRADKLKVYFREQEPLEIKGLINRMYEVPGNESQLEIYTEAYQLLDGTWVEPAIASPDYFRFENSIISVSQLQFKVVEIKSGNPWPTIIIEKILDTENVEDPDQPESFGSLQKYKVPQSGDKFSIVENLGNPANWSAISSEINLKSYVDLNNPVIETLTDSEGNQSKTLIGGITGNAMINRVIDDNDSVVNGYYTVVLENGISLLPHPQVNDPAASANNPNLLQSPNVEWYKGLIRVPSASNKLKLLEVVRIAETTPLKLYIYDPSYEGDEIKLSGSNNAAVSVNFHPGYKVYLFPEQSSLFKGDVIMPPVGMSDKKSLIGLQAIDSSTNSGFTSSVSLPAVIIARRIEKPVKPDLPIALGLKVRPDATNKAAFTFDLKLNASRMPVGLAFYRASQQDVLDALYAPETVTNILEALENLTSDPYYGNRFYDLVNFNFNSYPAEPAPYEFPQPDKPGLLQGNESDEVKHQKYLNSIRTTLLPLTEQTPVLSFIKDGVQTDNKLPNFRTIDGNLLDPLHPDFDPFPMIRKYPMPGDSNFIYVRFTDYNLNANSRNLYFYTAAEVTSQLTRGPLSPFLGPVLVLQTKPAPAPIVKKHSLLTNGQADTQVAVQFLVSPYSKFENISKLRIYRASSRFDSLFLSTMQSAFTTNVDAALDMIIEDSFSDLADIPYGKALFYRIAAIRTIINENDGEEDIISSGSEVLEVRIPDLLNPVAPALTYNQVKKSITWNSTAYNASYFLYKQNQRGNWEKISQELKGNSAFEFALTDPLQTTDEDGDRIYHRFKVKVFNSSGLINLEDKELTI